MEKLTDWEATVLRVYLSCSGLSNSSLRSQLPDWLWEKTASTHNFRLRVAMDSLAQYDVDQAAKRAAEIEAAYKEGCCISDDDFTDADEHWANSNAKKSLEAK